MSIVELKYFLKKYKAEIIISIVVAIMSTIVGIVAGALLQDSSPRMIIDISIGSIIVLLLLAILFNLKRLLTNLIFNAPLQKIVQVDDFFRKDKYWERLKHFSKEKDLLANTLVTKTLPNVVEKMCKDNPEIININIILDSGTTITPIFKKLSYEGITCRNKNVKFTIYTNNLAGIEEIHKIDSLTCKIDEREFNLIGGKPLNTYRATTGELTQEFLNTIWEKQNQDKNKGKIITLGILTANWFTCGADFEKIALCAKGEGHFDFKKDVVINSHYIILVSPMGKLLPMKDFTLLNQLVPKEPGQQYCSFPIPQEKKDKTYLLTSLRSKNSLSPIANTSIRLKNIKYNNEETNYILSDDCPTYNPEGDEYEIIMTEVPHQYIRDKFSRVFNAELWKGRKG